MDKQAGLYSIKVQVAGRLWRFSYSRSQVKSVAEYIADQEKHHRKKTFLEEYEQFLKHFEIEFDKQYIFKSLE